MNRFPAVSIEYSADGLVELTQQNGLSDPDFVELHPLHVRHIAQHMGLLRPDPDHLAIDTMRRQMLTLREHIAELDDLLQSVMSCPPSSRMTQDCILSSELLELIDGYIDDFATRAVSPSAESPAVAERESSKAKPCGAIRSAPQQLEIPQ